MVRVTIVADAVHNGELHPALIDALSADRESLNARFVMRQRGGAKLDEAAFREHLRTTVNSLVVAVANVLPERTRAVVNALFDVSLDLFAVGLLGRETKHLHVAAAWNEVLPSAAKLLARDPARVTGCLSNAVEHLASQPSARPNDWIAAMRELSPHCDSVSRWLDVGKVAAWRAGLVQYRGAALQIVADWPPAFAARCLGIDGAIDVTCWPRFWERLMADPWLAPACVTQNEPLSAAPRLIRVTGGFRGFGGPCLRPPSVTTRDEQLFVTDGELSWRLLADVFGTLWQRVPKAPTKSVSPAKVAVDVRGRVSWDSHTANIPELAESSGFACDGTTLAVTLPTSHHVFLVARST